MACVFVVTMDSEEGAKITVRAWTILALVGIIIVIVLVLSLVLNIVFLPSIIGAILVVLLVAYLAHRIYAARVARHSVSTINCKLVTPID